MNLKPSAFFIVDPSYCKLAVRSAQNGNLSNFTYLDRLLVLFVVEGHVGGIQSEEVPNLIRHIGSHTLVPAILEPHLKQPFLCPQRQTCSDDGWLLELLAWCTKRESACFKSRNSTQMDRSARVYHLPIIANKIDSHILSMLSSFLILTIQIPPFGDS